MTAHGIASGFDPVRVRARAAPDDQQIDRIRPELRQLFADLDAAAKAHDRAALERIYPEECVFIHGTGAIADRTRQIDRLMDACVASIQTVEDGRLMIDLERHSELRLIPALVGFGARQQARPEQFPRVLLQPLGRLSVFESTSCGRSGTVWRKTSSSEISRRLRRARAERTGEGGATIWTPQRQHQQHVHRANHETEQDAEAHAAHDGRNRVSE